MPNIPDHQNTASASENGVQRRSTRQREIVLEAVLNSTEHPTADEVYKLAHARATSISLATVYRNLNLLLREGKIREVQFRGDGGATRYDGMLSEHSHFICEQCGKVHDIDERIPAKLRRSVAAGEVHSYRLDFYGICNVCNGK